MAIPLHLWLRVHKKIMGIKLREFGEYSTTLEGLLIGEGQRLKAAIDAEFADMPEADRELLSDAAVADLIVLEDTFPAILRDSLFVQSYSLFEIGMLELANTYSRIVKGGLSLSDLGDKGISRAHIYLKKVACRPFPDESPEWAQICTLNRLRNLMVHNNGLCPPQNDSRRKEFDKLAEQWPGLICVNRLDHFDLSAGFVPKVLSTMAAFLNKLFAGLLQSDA